MYATRHLPTNENFRATVCFLDSGLFFGGVINHAVTTRKKNASPQKKDKHQTFAKQNHSVFIFTHNRDAEAAGVSLTK